jgi:hypothetical protein
MSSEGSMVREGDWGFRRYKKYIVITACYHCLGRGPQKKFQRRVVAMEGEEEVSHIALVALTDYSY